MTTPEPQTTPATTHIIREVQEGTINPRYRCSCGWEATVYNAADRAALHFTNAIAQAQSEQPAPSEDSLTCLNCGEPLELVRTGKRNVLVTKLSGDEGGTYDQCEATPFDQVNGTYGPHKRAR
jgi:hypothetical protein